MPSDRAYWSPIRIAIWGIAAYAVVFMFGPLFMRQFLPPERRFLDFSQEWLSARNYWSGTPIYADQTAALARHTDISPEKPEEILPWNAHPPAAVVLTLPFGLLDYRTAHLVWNLLTFPLFLLSVWVIIRDLKFPVRIWSLFPAIVLLLLCTPLYYQVSLGQINFVLLFLMTLAWAADRRDCPCWAGVALGAAACLKLYPLFAFAYFLFSRRWAALATGALVFLGVNGISVLLLGWHEWETYIRSVIPSLYHYQSAWQNCSLNGFWLRLFDPHPDSNIIPVLYSPVLGQTLSVLSRLLIVAIVARSSWFATSVQSRDRAYAAMLVGMILICPFTWTHYFTLLALPLGLVWMRLESGLQRCLFWATLVIMWVPENLFVHLMEPGSHEAVPPLYSLVCFPVFTYALLVLFILVLRSPGDPVEAG